MAAATGTSFLLDWAAIVACADGCICSAAMTRRRQLALPAFAFALVLAACGESTTSPAGATPPSGTQAPVATTAATSAPASVSPAASAVPVMADPVRRIPLPGSAPAAMVVAQAGVWVYSIESGDVTLTDPTAGTTGTTVHIGGFGSHVVLGKNGQLYVARFETGGSGSYLVRIDPASGGVSYGSTGVLGALTESDGFLYALEKDDHLVRIDETTLQATATADIDIDDEHMEVVIADGAAWVSSDHTPVRRVALPGMTVADTIDVGGGIPFVFTGDVIWGARPGTLWVLDPGTQETREIPLPGVDEILAMDVDVDTNEAWLAVRMTGRVGAVLRVDVARGAIVGTAPVSLPAAVKIVGSEVYVASYLDNELLVYRRD